MSNTPNNTGACGTFEASVEPYDILNPHPIRDFTVTGEANIHKSLR